MRLEADAALSNDSTKAKKITDKTILVISVNCKMNDSIKKELWVHFYGYYLKWHILRSSEDDKLQKLVPIKIDFIKRLKQKFGNDVYNCYKEILKCRTLPIPNQKTLNKQNRITERTSE